MAKSKVAEAELKFRKENARRDAKIQEAIKIETHAKD